MKGRMAYLLATKVGRLALIAQVKGKGIDGVLGRILLRSGIILHALHVQPLLFTIEQVGSHVLANLFTAYARAEGTSTAILVRYSSSSRNGLRCGARSGCDSRSLHSGQSRKEKEITAVGQPASSFFNRQSRWKTCPHVSVRVPLPRAQRQYKFVLWFSVEQQPRYRVQCLA